jgi:hypothetical protein
MTSLLNRLTSSLNAKKHSIVIFCDLKKAFDTCDHDILLKKLKNLGVTGTNLKWFENYLKGRLQFVSINNSISKTTSIKKGVPQGSILGPILFLIYINDLPLCTNLESLLFADDTTLYESDENIESLIAKVNIEFTRVTQYFRANRLSLHPEKTKFILFTNSLAVQNLDVNLFINNNSPDSPHERPDLVHKMERITAKSKIPAMKFLGVYFDPSLNFQYHVEKIFSKISLGLYMLRTVKNTLNQKALKALYYTLIHCHLVYAIQIWSCCSKKLLKDLFSKQKMAIRIVSGLKYNAHTEPTFKKLSILPFPSLTEYFVIQFMQRYTQGFLPVIFNNTWITNAVRRGDGGELAALRNGAELHIPPARTNQTDSHPLTNFPRTWVAMAEESAEICFIRNKVEFDRKLKKHLLAKLSPVVICNRLLYCPSCNNH